MTFLTKHGRERIEERYSLRKGSAERLVKKAWDCGIRESDTSGALREYMQALAQLHKEGTLVRIWAQKIFIFRTHVLITTFPLPKNFHPMLKKFSERRKK